jgi:cytochrome c oxidase assembly factor CtaG
MVEHPWHWSIDIEWVVALVVFALDYAVVTWVLERRGHRVSRLKRVSFAAGLTLIAVALLSPIEHLALTSMLSFHLIQNVIIADWAPPLLLLGLTPVMVAAIARRPGVGVVIRPPVAMGIWVATWYLIHLPPVYDYALQHRAALGLEHIAFIVSGLIFWWPDIVRGSLSNRGRVLYLFVAMVVMMPLDIFIALHDRPLYDFYLHTPKLGGISALADQRIAGATTALMETAVLSIAMFIAASRLVAESRADHGYAVRRAESTGETGTPARGRSAS